MGTPILDESELAKLKRIVEVYLIAKEMTLLGEAIDPEQRTQLEIFEGFRHAYDHLMRIFAYRFEIADISEETEEKYTEANISSVHNHVIRAAYDAMDWVAVVIQERMARELEGYSEQTIHTVLPQYYPVIKPRITKLTNETFVGIRSKKDIGNDNTDNLIQYATLVRELKKYYYDTVNAKNALIEYEGKLRKTRRNEISWKIVGPIAGAIVGAILALIITCARSG